MGPCTGMSCGQPEGMRILTRKVAGGARSGGGPTIAAALVLSEPPAKWADLIGSCGGQSIEPFSCQARVAAVDIGRA
jgi:hypothetical protein